MQNVGQLASSSCNYTNEIVEIGDEYLYKDISSTPAFMLKGSISCAMAVHGELEFNSVNAS